MPIQTTKAQEIIEKKEIVRLDIRADSMQIVYTIRTSMCLPDGTPLSSDEKHINISGKTFLMLISEKPPYPDENIYVNIREISYTFFNKYNLWDG